MGVAALRAAFPERPLKLDAPISTWRNWVFGLLLLLFPIGIGWWGSTTLLPPLLTDLELRGGAVPVQGRVQGRCSTKYGLLQTCDMTVTAGRGKDGQELRQSLEYVFVDPHIGSYTVQVMADPSRPGLLTTDMGLNNLTSRALTFAGMVAFGLAMLVASFALIRRGGKEKRAMRGLSGHGLMPVPSYVVRDREGWKVTPADGGGQSTWQLPRKAEPFWLSPSQGIALAVTAPGAPLFPLDKDLRWADLTDEERARLRAVADPT